MFCCRTLDVGLPRGLTPTPNQGAMQASLERPRVGYDRVLWLASNTKTAPRPEPCSTSSVPLVRGASASLSYPTQPYSSAVPLSVAAQSLYKGFRLIITSPERGRRLHSSAVPLESITRSCASSPFISQL